MMTEKFKILTEFIKDMSSETADVETYLFVKDQISKYHLDININSKPIKNKVIEVNTILTFRDKEMHEKKSHFEFTYTTIIQIDETVVRKTDLEKIILCDLQNKIYENMEKCFLSLLHNSGFPEVKFEKKIDFEKLYKDRSN
tara:strand:- start:316 stop:741 length:426 start_codon:yes stop_codon:yes gene_type:complete